jgi:hypothetical protein
LGIICLVVLVAKYFIAPSTKLANKNISRNVASHSNHVEPRYTDGVAGIGDVKSVSIVIID